MNGRVRSNCLGASEMGRWFVVSCPYVYLFRPIGILVHFEASYRMWYPLSLVHDLLGISKPRINAYHIEVS
jgi:hypothetical protein